MQSDRSVHEMVPVAAKRHRPIVGRAKELGVFSEAFDRMLSGRRQQTGRKMTVVGSQRLRRIEYEHIGARHCIGGHSPCRTERQGRCRLYRDLLAYEGFPPSVVEAVMALTKREVEGVEEPYKDFIERAAQNPIARLVKLADLEDSMDLSRIPQPTAKDYARLEKYQAAKRVIEQAIAEGR
jgi:hypothetical protein